MKTPRLQKPWLLFVLLAIASLPAFAEDAPLKVEDPWIRAMPPSSSATAAFMTLRNSGDKDLVILGGSTPVAGEVKPMITTQTKVDGKDVMEMKFVESFVIPPGKKLLLAPGGDHLMLMKLSKVPKRNETIKLTITFKYKGDRSEIVLDVPVR